MSVATKPFDRVGFIIRYEAGETSDEETIEGFQELVNSGLAWKLQGHYGRMASAMIRQGLIVDPKAAPDAA